MPSASEVEAPVRSAAPAASLKRVAIVPAHNEEGSIAAVVREIRAFDPGLEVVVVDDGSVDRTAALAAEAGAHVVRLPFNLGIGGGGPNRLPVPPGAGVEVALPPPRRG